MQLDVVIDLASFMQKVFLILFVRVIGQINILTIRRNSPLMNNKDTCIVTYE